jgi:hypothetical protein
MKTIIGLILCTGLCAAQQAINIEGQPYKIPFGSQGNSIELAVVNQSSVEAKEVTVEIEKMPLWLKCTTMKQTVGELKAQEEKSAEFSFSVEKNAPVNQTEKLILRVKNLTGELWKKEITLTVAPPERSEVYQNYPNPFNPTTTITYQLSGNSKVSLKIYDLLGREIANLADEQQEAGYHQAIFNVRHLASGMYVYQLIATDEQNNQQVFHKTMMLLR